MFLVYLLILLVLRAPLAFATPEAGTVAFVPGSFDPPTVAHLALIEAALARAEKVYVLVNRYDRKEHGASFSQRAEMLQLALREYGSRVRILAEPPEGTRQLEDRFGALHPGKIYRFIGQDLEIPATPISRNLVYVVADREGPVSAIPDRAQVEPLHLPFSDGVSSSRCRELRRLEAPPDSSEWSRLLPLPVLRYIFERDLYRLPVAEEAAAKESEFYEAYSQYLLTLSETVAARTDGEALAGRLRLGRLWSAAAPRFNPLQSPEEWRNVFDRHVAGLSGRFDARQCHLLLRLLGSQRG